LVERFSSPDNEDTPSLSRKKRAVLPHTNHGGGGENLLKTKGESFVMGKNEQESADAKRGGYRKGKKQIMFTSEE